MIYKGSFNHNTILTDYVKSRSLEEAEIILRARATTFWIFDSISKDMHWYVGKYKFKEILTYVVKAQNRREAEIKLRQMESNYWKLDLETIYEEIDA